MTPKKHNLLEEAFLTLARFFQLYAETGNPEWKKKAYAAAREGSQLIEANVAERERQAEQMKLF